MSAPLTDAERAELRCLCVEIDDEPYLAQWINNSVLRLLDENDELHARARRFYAADGSFIEMESEEAVIAARKEAAVMLAARRAYGLRVAEAVRNECGLASQSIAPNGFTEAATGRVMSIDLAAIVERMICKDVTCPICGGSPFENGRDDCRDDCRADLASAEARVRELEAEPPAGSPEHMKWVRRALIVQRDAAEKRAAEAEAALEHWKHGAYRDPSIRGDGPLPHEHKEGAK